MVTNTTDSFAAWSKVKAINKYITFDSLISKLNKTRRCQATDPLDKVYALLPLLSLAGFEIDLVPNYEHSPARVYIDFATILMEQQGFDWLEAVGGRSGLEGLPSWVPDWTIPLSGDVLPGPHKSIEETRARKTLSIPRPVVRKDPALGTTCLETTGEPFGRIKRLSSTYIPGLGPFPKSDHFPLQEWRSVVAQEFSPHAETDDTWKARWRSNTMEDWEMKLFDCIITAGPGWRPEHIVDYIEDGLDDTRRFHPYGRRIFVTDMGNVGLGCAEAEVDDCVYRLDSMLSQHDFVFRDADSDTGDQDGRRLVKMVGSCYIENSEEARRLQNYPIEDARFDLNSFKERLQIM
jgi:hypothetical protein